MKKIILLGLVLLLLAVSVVPVMAKNGSSNGQGNGDGNGQGNGDDNGQGNNGGNNGRSDQAHDRQQEKKQERLSNPGSQGNNMGTPFYLQGTISAIDPAAMTVTVTVVHANAKVREFMGSDLLLQASEATLIFKIVQGGGTAEGSSTSSPTTSGDGTPGNRVPIPFDQLEVGRRVAIHGDLIEEVYTTRLITEYIRADTGEAVSEP